MFALVLNFAISFHVLYTTEANSALYRVNHRLKVQNILVDLIPMAITTNGDRKPHKTEDHSSTKQ